MFKSIRKIIDKFMKHRTVDMMFMQDIRVMEKAVRGERFFCYIAEDGIKYKRKFRWWSSRGYLHFEFAGFYQFKTKGQKLNGTLCAIWGVNKSFLGLKSSYYNPRGPIKPSKKNK